MTDEQPLDPNELMTVYETFDPTKAELIRAELQSEGIACTIEGENQAALAGVLPIRVQVRAVDYDKAYKFLEKHHEE